MSAIAQDDPAQASPDMPGSVFLAPEVTAPYIAPEDDMEVTTDLDSFLSRGFQTPDWATHTAQVDEVLKDVVLPDWRKRTGNQEDPQLPSIDIAAEFILGGDFNDLLVMSRLPGDCGPTGCLFQIYSLVNEVWVKRFEFKTVAFAWKRNEDGTAIIAQVGGMWIPSKTYVWANGKLN